MHQPQSSSKSVNKKYVYAVFLSIPLVIGVNQGIFWLLQFLGTVEKSKEHHVMVISTSLLMAGFLLHSTNMSIQARSDQKLKALRESAEWAVMDTSIISGEILLLTSGIWSTLTMFYKLDDNLSYSFQVSLFLSGVLYIFVVVIASRKAMKYL